MRITWKLVIIFGVCIVAVILRPVAAQQQATGSDPRSSYVRELDRFRDIAARAKAVSKTSVTYPAPSGPEIEAPSLDVALTHFSTIIVEPYSKQTVMDAGVLHTWYKCRLIETLSLANETTLPAPQELKDFPLNLQPSGLLPLVVERDILWFENGGSMLVDGVTISTPAKHSPSIDLGSRYLILAALSSAPTVAIVPLSSKAVFLVTGDRLTSAREEPEVLGLDMEMRHNNSLSNLRDHVRLRRSR